MKKFFAEIFILNRMKSVAPQHKYTVKHKNTAIFPFRLRNICTITNITLYFFISYYSVFLQESDRKPQIYLELSVFLYTFALSKKTKTKTRKNEDVFQELISAYADTDSVSNGVCANRD